MSSIVLNMKGINCFLQNVRKKMIVDSNPKSKINIVAFDEITFLISSSIKNNNLKPNFLSDQVDPKLIYSRH